MKLHIQIDYERPAATDEERAEYGDTNDAINVETLTAVDFTTDAGAKMARAWLEEFLKMVKHNPATASFSIGGECKCHKSK